MAATIRVPVTAGAVDDERAAKRLHGVAEAGQVNAAPLVRAADAAPDDNRRGPERNLRRRH